MTKTSLRVQQYFLAASLAALAVTGCSGRKTELGHLAGGNDGGQQISDASTSSEATSPGTGGASGNSSDGSGGGTGADSTGGGAGANNIGGSGGSASGKGIGGTAGGASGTSTGTGGTSTGPVVDAGTPGPFSAATAESFCLGYFTYYYHTFGICFAGDEFPWQSLPASVCKRILKSVAAGRMQYDPTRGATCLSAMAAVTGCPLPTNPDWPESDCQFALVPQVPLGGTCTIISPDFWSAECVAGYCDEGGVSFSCSGTCLSYLDVGASCTWNGPKCKLGTTCSAGVLSAKPGQCVARVGAGQTCDGPGGPSCLSPNKCVGGSNTVAGVCQMPATSGACTSSTDCAYPTNCVGPTGNQQCLPPKQAGAACTPGNRECLLLSHCTAAGVCSDHLGVEGEPCGTILGELVSCQDGFYCEAPIAGSGVCHADKAPVATCTGTPGECPGYQGHCDSVTSTCVSCDD